MEPRNHGNGNIQRLNSNGAQGIERATNSSKKQLTIKPFKQSPKLPENYEIKAWKILEEALQAVYTKSRLDSVSKEELYQIVEDLCLQKKTVELYEKLSSHCKIFVETRIQRLINDHLSLDLLSFITVVDEMWRDHCEVMTTVRNIFIYLDRSYALSNPNIASVWDVGLNNLHEQLHQRRELLIKIITALLATVEADRQGRSVEVDPMQRILRMFNCLGIYKEKFEIPFFEDSRRFFGAEGRSLIDSCDVANFLEHVERRIVEAKEMVSRYLDPSSRLGLVQIIEQDLFAPHVTSLLERGLIGLLDTDRLPELKRFYSLLERINQLDDLRVGWVNYLRKSGELIIQEDEKNEKTIIDDILSLQDRADNTLKTSFSNNESFKQSLKSTMSIIVNLKCNRFAELLARYIDRKLRGEKGMQETDTELSFDKIVILFKLVHGKDVFEAFYKKFLSKRLLLGKSASYELERSMLSRLKTECGAGFTSKLEGMFQDIELSRDTMTAYSRYAAPLSNQGIEPETSIQVLTIGFWPSPQTMDGLIIPTDPFGPIMTRFERFYRDKYSGRRLTWTHGSGRCIVSGRFCRGTVKKELEVSFYQALILLCFKDVSVDQLSFKQILHLTGLEEGEGRRTLQSLACGVIGTRVLSKHPKGKDVDNDDVFKVNEEFNNKLYRVKINTIQLKETVEEVEKTHEEVFRERLYQVDAAIVRIMKARKRLSHNILMSELLSQLRFPARPQDIKQRIESLIERDYLERDRDDSSFYNYRA